MRKNKFNKVFKVLMSFLMAISMVHVTNIVANDSLDNLVLNKEATYDATTDQVNYVLEAYSKGSVTQTDNAIPTDVILVLDQSGSMTSAFDGGPRRIDALKSAVTLFATNTYNHATANNVNHKISIVGFGSGPNYLGGGYEGSEILTTTDNVPIRYRPSGNTAVDQALANSLMDVTVQADRDRIVAGITNIAASGWTYTNLGMDMASRIINGLPADPNRAQAVIVFTDGEPNGAGGTGQSSFTASANAALTIGQLIKDKQVPIYTVAIFNGADPAAENTNNNFVDSSPQRVDRFLHYLSSNYTGVTDVTSKKPLNNAGKYLVANNATDLNNIFQTIQQEITNPGVALDATTQLVDIVSEEFVAPAAADVELFTQDYLGGDDTLAASWGALTAFTGTTTVVDNKVTVTGFDYSDNYLIDGTGHTTETKGKKLVVKFSAKPIDGFLGGNEINTNVEGSGIHNPAASPTLVKPFGFPIVDIARTPEFITRDVNMYLTNELNIADLVMENGHATYTLGGVEYTVDGLRNKHVDLVFNVMDSSSHHYYTVTFPAGSTTPTVTSVGAGIDLHLEEDYLVNHGFTMTPIVIGTAPVVTGSYTSNVHVFMPKAKATDATVYRGESYDLANAHTHTGWHHATLDYATTTMTPGYDEPAVTFTSYFDSGTNPADSTPTYYPEFDSVFESHIWLDGVDRTDKTVLETDSVSSGHKVFVLTKNLIINKEFEVPHITSQNFLFEVEWDKPAYLGHFINDYGTSVLITAEGQAVISGLPIGDFRVTEDTDWSWRYEVVGENPKTLTLIVDDIQGEVTFVNKRIIDKWLDDEALEINIFKDTID